MTPRASQKTYHLAAAQEPQRSKADNQFPLTGRDRIALAGNMRRDELADSTDGFALWLATEGGPKARGTITNYCEVARDLAS